MNATMNCIYIRKLWMVNWGWYWFTHARAREKSKFVSLFSARGRKCGLCVRVLTWCIFSSPERLKRKQRNATKNKFIARRRAAKGKGNDAELLTSTKYRREKRRLATRWDDTPSGDVCLQCGTAQTQERTRQTKIIIPLLRRRRRKYTLSLINTPRFRAVTSIISSI